MKHNWQLLCAYALMGVVVYLAAHLMDEFAILRFDVELESGNTGIFTWMLYSGAALVLQA